MLELIKKLLQQIIDDLDVGNSNLSEQECIEIIDIIKKYSNREEKLSKYQAYTYLNISRATFDNLVREGKLPQGKKQQGFKELSWTKKEIDKYIKKYNIN